MIREIVIWLQPLIEWFAKIRIPYSKKRITGKEYYKMRDEIKPGAVLLTSVCGELSNLINPSDYKHGAVYVGGDKVKYVIEATSKGVIKTDLVTFMLTKDKIRVYDPLLSTEMRQMAVSAAPYHIGTPYDFAFDLKNERFYCFEFIANLFETYSEMKGLKKSCFLGYDVYDSSVITDDPKNFNLRYSWGE